MARNTNGRKVYPFGAIVGQEDLKLCLILCAIDPSIGGLLVRGDKGTAKSTAARGVARLLPPIEVAYDSQTQTLDPFNRSLADATLEEETHNQRRDIPTPFVDLPIGATEDRVLGSLDFSKTLQQQGKPVFAPGLLAAANRGILYIDEVNLLPAHLVDALLDAAAMGVNTIQREGVTQTHPSKFVLIGTMNPEEGNLRPQLLDRFGLMVDIVAPRDVHLRAEVVRRRIAFERDPDSFRAQWEEEQSKLTQQIQDAQERLPKVVLSEESLLLISRICNEFQVDSLRADITLYKTATALAAWQGRLEVVAEDIRQAVEWVLGHRRRQQPFQSPEDNQHDTNERLEQLINSPPEDKPQEQASSGSNQETQGEEKSSSIEDPEVSLTDRGSDDKILQTFTASKPNQIKRLQLGKQSKGQPGTGRRNPLTNTPQRGHYVRSVPTDKPVDIALDATLRAATVNGLHPATGRPVIHPENWRRKVRNSTTDTIILFVVDASGSMSARQRMEAVKGAVLALLTDAYQQRDRVGVIAFRGTQAEVLLEPTRSVELAAKHLQRLPTGGRTPLAHALSLTCDTIHRLCRHQPDQAILLLILSDGKANVPLPASSEYDGSDSWAQTQQVAGQLAALCIPTLMVDTESGHVRVGRGKELAGFLHADYLRLDDLSADGLVHTIRQAVG